MNFLDFVKHKQINKLNESLLLEAFKNDDVKKAHEAILSLFKKKIDGKVLMDPMPMATKSDGKNTLSYIFLQIQENRCSMMWTINYLQSGKSVAPYSVDFFDEEGYADLMLDSGKATAKLSLNMLGASIVYYIPVICHIVNGGNFDLSEEDAIKNARKVYNVKNEAYEFPFYLGAQKYTIIEGFSADGIEAAFHITMGHTMKFNEGLNKYEWVNETEAEDKKQEVYGKWKNAPEGSDESKQFYKEYRAISQAIKGGAKTIDDLKIALKKDVSVVVRDDKSVEEAEVKFEQERKNPDQAFKEMKGYVKTVIKGLQPGVILCGAPGIGKTYRVLQQLKAAGYKKDENLHIIKGKCTTRNLYLDLYHFQNKGELVLIDDADSLVGPKAPEDCINILKAALDSTTDDDGGRTVSYRVSGKLVDDDDQPVPKEFSYRGGVIVITNYAVGQLDTAIRGRVFTQSLDFTTEQLLQIIKDIMPAIDPANLSARSKAKAYDYLLEMAQNGSQIEISIRSFGTCARLFEICAGDDDFTDDDAKSMIKEQMENQARKTGKHF